MKRTVSIVISIMTLAILSSCEKATVLSIDQQLLTFTESGGSQILSLTANKPWTVSSDQSWCKVTPTAGEEATSSRISINCDPNTTYDTRYCTITFTCAELTKTVSVTQDASEGMLVSQTDFDISNEAQQVSVEIKANVKFSVAVDEACKGWIRHSATKGLTTSTVILDISKNEDYDGREGRVTISQIDGSLFSTIKIRQSQNNGLFITTSEYELSNESHQLSVEVKSNINFEVTSGASWIKYVETKSLNTSFIVLDIEANQDYAKREGKVIVKQKGGGLEGVITVKQDQNYGLLITQTEYELSNEAQTIDVEIKHNVDFDVVIPADCKGWISKVSTKGLETSTLSFSIAKNDTHDSREGSITFKQKTGALSGTVSIKQAQLGAIIAEHYGDLAKLITPMLGTMAADTITTVSVLGRISAEDFAVLNKLPKLKFLDLSSVSLINNKVPEQAFLNNYKLTSIILPNEVETIGSQAFMNCISLKMVDFPPSLALIDAYAFYGCSEMKGELRLPESITQINEAAFAICLGLSENLIIPQNMKYIGPSAFMGCTGLNGKLVFSTKEDLSIGEKAFSGCSNFSGDLVIPKNVFPGSYSFEGTGFTGSLYVHNVGWYSFYNCKIGENLIICDDVTNLGNAFRFIIVNGYTYIGKEVVSLSGQCFSPNDCNVFYVAAVTPPTCANDAIVLYGKYLGVPKGRVEVYKAAGQWNTAAIIEEVDFSKLKLEPYYN